ncbi:MAG: PD-(D/E)XK nuclease family protein, partial [Desulfovibrio sp.]|nr:PD-(D/E)XK nuclease family protein [Desulfovibrio sp.]
MNRPFLLIPRQRNFLKILLDIALRDTDGDLGRAVFVFPHARPARYLPLLLRERTGRTFPVFTPSSREHTAQDTLSASKSPRRPLFLPRTFTATGLMEELNRLILPRSRRRAGLLDRIGLLLAALREESRDTDMPFDTDAANFFPWGIRLAELFEECFVQMSTPVNFRYAEDLALPYAQKLLARLRPLFIRYRSLLDAGDYTTEGLNARTAAEFVGKQGGLPENFLSGALFSAAGTPAETVVYLAGFHMPTGAEDIIFHRMRDDLDARVVIHADEALTRPGDGGAHWSCLSFADWAARWETRMELAPGCGGERGKEPRIRFYAAYDLHSQLDVLRRELTEGYGEEHHPPAGEQELAAYGGERPHPSPGESAAGRMSDADAAGDRSDGDATGGGSAGDSADDPFNAGTADDRPVDTAVFLPRGDLLLPVLHHLPHTDINISMGLPLARSPLARLTDTAARLQEGRKGNSYYRRDLLDLLRHPYVTMLRPEGTGTHPGTDAGFRRELFRLDLALRTQGHKYVNLYALIEDLYQATPPEDMPPAPVLALLEETCRVFLDAFVDIRDAAGLAAALDGVCRLVLRCGARLLERFPIDAECLYRLRRSLIAELAASELSAEQLPQEALFTLLRGLLDNERVPFEAEPLVGLQVMGMLESRLLGFRRVIIVDAVEDALPGSPEGDPLLPDVLRPELGLPSRYAREQLVAHTFFSLVAGAEELVLLWREGDDAGAPGEKKKKSRFVEELIWQEEKKRRRLLTGQEKDGTLTVLSPAVLPMNSVCRNVVVDDATRALIGKLLARRVSVSLLDAWLRCPAAFFYERLARITPAVEAVEGDDPLAVGNMLHAALRDFYAERLHCALPAGASAPAGEHGELCRLVVNTDIGLELFRKLPADSRIMVEEAVRKRLASYLQRQPSTTVLAVECSLAASFACSPRPEAGAAGSGFPARFSLAGTVDRLDLRSCICGAGGKKKP